MDAIEHAGVRFRIACPSRGRPKRLLEHPLLGHLWITVREQEYEDYRAVLGQRPAGLIPVRGAANVAKARNRAIEHVYDDDLDFLFMVDDDLNVVTRLLGARVKDETNPDEIVPMIVETACLASYAGARLFGFEVREGYYLRDVLNPFGWRQMVAGAVGLLDPTMRYDEVLGTSEDWDISLEAMSQERIVLLDRRAIFRFDRGTQGGAANYRTQSLTDQTAAYLQEKWGSKIVQPTDGKMSIRIKVN